MSDLKIQIEQALKRFSTGPPRDSARKLLNVLGYDSDKTEVLEPNTFAGFREEFLGRHGHSFNEQQARSSEWSAVDLIFQLTDEELTGQHTLFSAGRVDNRIINSFLFMSITLTGPGYTRTDLVRITREVNKLFPMPVILLIRYAACLTIAVIDRRLNMRDVARDVLEKVTLIKDINVLTPHRAHIEILHDLALANLRQSGRIDSFVELFNAWRRILDISELNKRFYRDLANWYFWALREVEFPDDVEPNREVRTAEGVIRLITRLVFVWFLREKNGLVPDDLFDERALAAILTDEAGCDLQSDATVYYRAILQNLFFATLNVPMAERVFRSEERFHGRNKDYMNHRVYRYARFFRHDTAFENLFSRIPFLNGGLFECLDFPDETGRDLRIDCFSDRAANRTRLRVPDKLFFGAETVDLSETYQDRKKNHVPVKGIIHLLNDYKFTIAENTPVEEEIALDPELLGRVFENLLASYNPETRTTARKLTGSFYTPRNIVDYMVDEALMARLKARLIERLPALAPAEVELDARLRQLFSYNPEPHRFTEAEVEALVTIIQLFKVLDPACGSGAFPMGILHRMVHVLAKLDPDNERWRELQRRQAIRDTEAAYRLGDREERQRRLLQIEAAFEDNASDYGRKLFLISNCIYGVDLQPVAIQISKLRFFISLLVDFTVDRSGTRENFGILPLPNLEYKLMQGNSLLEDFHGYTLNMADLDDGSLIRENSDLDQLVHDLHNKQDAYLREARPREKDRLKKEVEADIVRIFDTFIRRKQAPYFAELDGLQAKTRVIPDKEQRREYLNRERERLGAKYGFNAEKMERELLELTHGYKPRDFFPWQLYFADVFRDHGGFDITIGNPPYVRADSGELHLEMRQRLIACGKYETLWEKWDLYIPFMELGYKLLSPGGVTSMIVSDAYCHAKYAQKSQNWFMAAGRVLRLDFLSRIKVFDAAVHNIIYLFQKGDGTFNQPERRVHYEEFENVTLLPTDVQPRLNHRVFFPEDEATAGFTGPTLTLADICYISKGMVVHADEKEAKGAFELSDLVSEVRDDRHPKPFVEGKHLARWLPARQKWLEWGTSRAPSFFSRPTFPELYEVPEKLISVDMAAGVAQLRVAYDNQHLYHNHSAWSFVPWQSLAGVRNNSLKKAARYVGEKPVRHDLPKREELERTSRRFSVKFLLAVMNSATARDFLRANRRSNIHLYPDDWKQLPIPDVPPEKQAPIVALVEQILAAKKHKKQTFEVLETSEVSSQVTDIPALEAEIDRLVYALYGLTDEEIAMVEGKA